MRVLLASLLLVMSAFPARAADDVRPLLEELVASDTTNPPGNEARAVDVVAKRLAAAGIKYEIVPFGPGRASVVARLKGDGSKRPLLLLAHLDVVGAAQQPWTVPPFQLTEKDGFLYGRGVVDDKGWAAEAVSVLVELQRTHARLHRDVVLALTGDEESSGAGIRAVLDKRPELLSDVELALNEGGQTLVDAKGKVRLVQVQTAEKVFQSFELIARGRGGHSSVPNDENAIYRLARALARIERVRFAPRLTPTVRGALKGRALLEPEPLASALKRIADAKETIPEDALRTIDAVPPLRALPRTTCVATLVSGGTRENALPVEARATINCRMLPVDQAAEVTRVLAEAARPDAELHPVPDIGRGPEVPVTGVVMDAALTAARALYGADVTVTAGLGTGASDSRFLRARGVGAYGLGLLPVSPEDARKAHGPDERAPVSSLERGRAFLREMVRALAELP